MIHRTFMTMDNSKAEKRNYAASESEGPEGEESEKKTSHAYHRSAIGFLEKLATVAVTRIEDTALQREIVTVLSFVDGDLMNKSHRSQFNIILLKLYHDITNQSLKRQLKSRNKVLCTIDPSLEKI